MIRRIDVGILAHNEAERIGAMLASVLAQDIWEHSDLRVEVTVIVNGSTDATARLARDVLGNRGRVVEVVRPGKANAWNVFVHAEADPEADVLILADGDIELLERGTLASLVATLDRHPAAVIATDRPVKDVAHRGPSGPRERLSVAVSALSGHEAAPDGPSWVCGQLYAARGDFLRRLWLPTDLIMDDSFLWTMATTDRLTAEPDPGRVVLAPGASHLFEAYTGLGRLLRHQRWLIFGKGVNEAVYDSLRGVDVGEAVRSRNAEDPGWLGPLVASDGRLARPWNADLLTRRLTSLRGKRGLRALALAPVAAAATAVDAALALWVAAEYRHDRGASYWRGSGGWQKTDADG